MRCHEAQQVRTTAAALVRSVRNDCTDQSDAVAALHFEAGALYGMRPEAYPEISRALAEGTAAIRRAVPRLRPVWHADAL